MVRRIENGSVSIRPRNGAISGLKIRSLNIIILIYNVYNDWVYWRFQASFERLKTS